MNDRGRFRVLGIESSCDETAAAVVDDGRIVRSDVVASQNEVHARYGGVVPELASRAHILNVVPVVQAALDRAECTLDDIDGVAAMLETADVAGLRAEEYIHADR